MRRLRCRETVQLSLSSLVLWLSSLVFWLYSLVALSFERDFFALTTCCTERDKERNEGETVRSSEAKKERESADWDGKRERGAVPSQTRQDHYLTLSPETSYASM